MNEQNKDNNSEMKWPFGTKNYIIFGVALLVIIAGYIALSTGPTDSTASMTIAPILLVLGYCVLIPIALIVKDVPKE